MTDTTTGGPGSSEVPAAQPRRLSALIRVVEELNETVKDLREKLDNDYPTKKEVDNKRRWTVTWSILFVVCIIVAASFTTLGAVSYCFLQPNGPHTACGLLPGYNVSVDQRTVFLEQEAELRENIKQNRVTLLKMQQEIDELQKEVQQNPGG